MAAGAAAGGVSPPDDRFAPRLDLPPPPGAMLALPGDFGRRFAIFADAEEEFDWTRPFDRAATATRSIAALPGANRRFVERGIVPTYLVDWPVVDRPESAAILRRLVDRGECDIGAQLHPWVTPPHEEDVCARNSFAGNLPRALEGAKIAALTDRIAGAFGRRPLVFRAGRYGVGPHTGALLAEAGYRLDVSVRALFDYAREGGPDFSRHPALPWRVAPGLRTLPLTSALVGRLRRRARLPRAGWLRGVLARGGLLGRVALTPEGMPLAEVLDAIRLLLDDGHRLFSLSFHTPSLEPGHTPYVRDAADLARFWAWWDGVLGLFAREGVAPARADEIIAAFDAA